jgi:hypothetical protein
MFKLNAQKRQEEVLSSSLILELRRKKFQTLNQRANAINGCSEVLRYNTKSLQTVSRKPYQCTRYNDMAFVFL